MNREALTKILQRVSELVCELPEIVAMDINPLIGNDKEVIAVDARIEVAYRPPQMAPYGHMAIHPYPTHLIERVQLPSGQDLIIRPIRPEDAEMEQRVCAQPLGADQISSASCRRSRSSRRRCWCASPRSTMTGRWH